MPLAPGNQRFTPNPNVAVSPGVFSREIDQSGIAQGVAAIGGVVVAPFSKGPGFSPTLCNSVADLQNQFGVPDGTHYGPYTATQYLQEKGFVTVVRVGALTGYHQKYPWFIWAEEGEWIRASGAGWTDPLTSFISLAGVYFTSSVPSYISNPMFPSSSFVYSGTPSNSLTQSFSYLITGSRNATVILSSSILVTGTITTSSVGANITSSQQSMTQSVWYGSDFTGSVIFHNSMVSFQLMSGAIDGRDSFAPSINNTASWPNSGSSLYYGQTITGYISASFPITTSLDINSLINTFDSASIVAELIAKHQISGSIQLQNVYGLGNSNFGITTDPFENAEFRTTSTIQISQSLDFCNRPTINFLALLSGSIGTYTGGFTAGSSVIYDQCTREWTTSGSAYKLLGVLADTEWADIDSNLQAPGFLGSTQNYPSISGLDYINHEFDLKLSSSVGGGYGTYHFSLDPSDPQYITNVFGRSARTGNQNTYAQGTKKEAAYLYKIFEDDIATIIADPIHRSEEHTSEL